MSDPKPANNQTKKDSTSEDEDGDIYEGVSSDPNYFERYSYNEMYAIMPRFKPVNDWNKDLDRGPVINIFASSKERHKKGTKVNFDWVNHKTHPTKK